MTTTVTLVHDGNAAVASFRATVINRGTGHSVYVIDRLAHWERRSVTVACFGLDMRAP